jgi:diguanylate cyclase (GGDEF)-like protein
MNQHADAQDQLQAQLKERLEQMAADAPVLARAARKGADFSHYLADLKNQGLTIAVAEKLLYPPDGSVQVGSYTLLHAADGPFLRWLQRQDVEALSSVITVDAGFWVISRFVNEPRRTLVSIAATEAYLGARSEPVDALYRGAFWALSVLALLFFAVGALLLLRSRLEGRSVRAPKGIHVDPLTGLPGRSAFVISRDQYQNPALLLLNIDRFREINDFYGHQVGDFFIGELSKILRFYLPDTPRSALFRLGVDEFGVLLEDPQEGAALALAEQIVESIPKESVFYEDFEISCSMSVGIAEGGHALLERSDMALRHARNNTHHKLAAYSSEMDEERRYQSNLTWAKKIHDAIIDERVVPHFQPIVDTVTGKVVKHEALVRLVDDSGHEVLPFMFLRTARLSKQYAKLSRMMIKRCFAEFSLREDDLAINLSIDDITNHETVVFIQEQLRRYNLANRVTFEILESEEIEDYAHTHAFIKEMRALGCRFAIDDFGSGYSNFINIARLDVDYLKIDASLIRTIDTDEKSYLIVKSIVQFSKLLGLKTVAEHVHNEAVMTKSKELGIDYLQGFAIARPNREAQRED